MTIRNSLYFLNWVTVNSFIFTSNCIKIKKFPTVLLRIYSNILEFQQKISQVKNISNHLPRVYDAFLCILEGIFSPSHKNQSCCCKKLLLTDKFLFLSAFLILLNSKGIKFWHFYEVEI